ALTWEIIFLFALLGFALFCFVTEKIPIDLTAMTIFAILLVTGLLSVDRAFAVFANPAPLTVAAMFIISAALERCGAIDILANRIRGVTKIGYLWFMFIMILCV